MKAQAVALFFFFPFPSLFLFLLKPKRILPPRLFPPLPVPHCFPGELRAAGLSSTGPVIQCRASVGRMKSIRSSHSLYPQRTFENGKNETNALQAIITLLLLLFCFPFLVKATDLITWEGWPGPRGCTGISEGGWFLAPLSSNIKRQKEGLHSPAEAWKGQEGSSRFARGGRSGGNSPAVICPYERAWED